MATNKGFDAILPTLKKKDRTFVLTNNAKPLRYMIPTKHASTAPLYCKETNKALFWATNQNTPYMSEQEGVRLSEPIIFELGFLHTKAHERNLQKFLLIHGDFGTKFIEYDPEAIAEQDLAVEDLILDAQMAVREMDINELEPIAKIMMKTTRNLTTSEIRRDMRMIVKSRYDEFNQLANDENIKLRFIATNAVDHGYLKVLSDQRTVCWNDKKGEEVFKAPYGENVYTSLAGWFKTDEGIAVCQKLTNKMK